MKRDSGMALWEKGRRRVKDLKDRKELALHQQTPAGQKLVREEYPCCQKADKNTGALLFQGRGGSPVAMP